MTQPPQYGPPPQWGYPTPPPWGPPTSTVAIVALVMTFVFPPAGFVLGLVALSQIKKTGEGGRGLAVAAVAVSSAFTLLTAAVIALVVHLALSGDFEDGPVGSISEVGSTEVGTCLRHSFVVDCSTAHDEEVSYVSPILLKRYPSERAIRSLGNGICRDTFRGYVGTSPDGSDDDYDFYAPSRAEWDNGEHRLVCVVVPGSFDGTRFSRSQQGSGN